MEGMMQVPHDCKRIAFEVQHKLQLTLLVINLY